LPDSVREHPLAYGSIKFDPETKDASGVQFLITVKVGQLQVSVIDARGEMVPPRDVNDLRIESGDTLAFSYGTGPSSRSYHRLHLGCGALSGRGRLFVTQESVGMERREVFPRGRAVFTTEGLHTGPGAVEPIRRSDRGSDSA
jgi:hypothetical protein